MQKIEFGSTGLVIEKNGFGCLPIQRISETEAVCSVPSHHSPGHVRHVALR